MVQQDNNDMVYHCCYFVAVFFLFLLNDIVGGGASLIRLRSYLRSLEMSMWLIPPLQILSTSIK